ncbi:hypothetical protein J2Z80_000273 [Thermoanaerobacterium butyriciformans]|uniref:Uncharacterized protein n=1 Tax=Thermoanaerobacterium butyriciformans TaxID=1702242 RepID=A0ABS4NAX3_9THEO|nr:hypothetical protein [Thermoanaerobacterium butyriciformans]
MIRTYIICSCGKKFINSSESGYAFAIVNHRIKQLFYNFIAQIHFLLYKHKKFQTYETFK